MTDKLELNKRLRDYPITELSPEVIQEIALRIVTLQMLESDEPLANLSRGIGNIAKKIDVNSDTLKLFAAMMVFPRVISESLGYEKASVSILAKDKF